MYLFTTFVLSFLAALENFTKKEYNKQFLWFLCFVFFIFHDGCRNEIGTDWKAYSDFFQVCLDPIPNNYDIGYIGLNQLVRLLTDSYSVFLILFAILQYTFIFKSITKYSILPFLSLFLYYCTTLPVLGMNRQFIALCLCLFAIRYIVSRDLKIFSICILIGFFFHKSVIIFFPAYFLYKYYKRKYYILLLLFVIAVSLSGIINNLPLSYFALLGGDTADKMNFYADDFLVGNVSVSFVNSVLAIFKRSVWVFLLLFCFKMVKRKNAYYEVLFNIYYVSLLLYILFNNTILQIIVGRGLIYYNIAEIFIIPFVLTLIKDNWGKVLFFVLIILYGYTNMNKGLNYYPEAFFPYRNIFLP